MQLLKAVWVLALVCGLSFPVVSGAAASRAKVKANAKRGPMVNLDLYRSLTLNVLKSGSFQVALPGYPNGFVRYQLEFAEPVYTQPIVNDVAFDMNRPQMVRRTFWDRILLTSDSFVEIAGEKLPLTCVFVSAQDNRFLGVDPKQLPELVMRVHLIAKDKECQGPIRPGWPNDGGRKENWDTYLKFEVRDGKTMSPQEPVLRYQWLEYPLLVAP